MQITIEIGAFTAALFAIIVAFFEYKQLKGRRKSELFSELNKRYLADEKNIQPVIRYLSHLHPNAPVPEGYQIELFLRFFEEIDVYLKEEALDEETTYHLFAYYCLEIFKTEEYASLLDIINFRKEEWPLLDDFVMRMKDIEHKLNNKNNGTNQM